tara:strand:+ start:1252 stop:1830 length:579 start_codon:yes stop_codon:yes gene_type:complete
MVLIGIVGNKGHGKDTIGDYLVDEYKFNKVSFATPLKNICKELFNFNHEQLYGDKKEVIDKEWNITPREVMQFIGTDLIRNQISTIIPNVKNDFWIIKLLKSIKDNKNYVICDVRFQNEIDHIKKSGGFIIKVIRPEIKENQLNNHQSENINNLHNIDYIIKNIELQKLYNKIDILIKNNNIFDQIKNNNIR